jgi:ABC-2 type transport system ATP-binding protein
MITVASASKAFGAVVALDRVSLEIGAGERVAFVGSNGSGKTTLLRALLGLVRVEGRVTIDGVDVAREPEVALRSVAYVPQVAPPIESPVGEVLRAYAAIRKIRVEDVAARAARLGLDVETAKKKRFRDLSGGTKQKLLAAMALASGAPILACDEPTANLDEEARRAFFAEIAAWPARGIVILSSHRTSEIQDLVQRVVEMKDGRVASDGALPSESREARDVRETKPRLAVVRAS